MISRKLLLIGLVPALMLLTACEKTDTDLVVDFVNTWLESRGAMSKDANGNYVPTLKGVGVAMGYATTGDPQADAAIEAGKVTKDIADNDKLVNEAYIEQKKNPPNDEVAEKKLDAAVNNRPDDWYYRNHRAYFHLDHGNAAQADADLKAGVDGCAGNAVCLAALHKDRAHFYANYTLGAFMGADPRMRGNCGVHALGVESYEALVNLTKGAEQQNYRDGLKTAKDQQQQAC